jgi:hypothetical protein
MSGDVEAILDKRRGQLQDYRIGPDLKGQMIVQFVLELAEGGKASGAAVARSSHKSDCQKSPRDTLQRTTNR